MSSICLRCQGTEHLITAPDGAALCGVCVADIEQIAHGMTGGEYRVDGAPSGQLHRRCRFCARDARQAGGMIGLAVAALCGECLQLMRLILDDYAAREP